MKNNRKLDEGLKLMAAIENPDRVAARYKSPRNVSYGGRYPNSKRAVKF